MLNKPAGCITTRSDQRGRPTVMDLVQDLSDTIYPVGRLDLETEGLLLFTNDGDFAYRLLHPSHKIEKTYIAWVKGVPRHDVIQKLRRGVRIPSGTTAPAKVRRLKISKDGRATAFEVTIHEGKKTAGTNDVQSRGTSGHPSETGTDWHAEVRAFAVRDVSTFNFGRGIRVTAFIGAV